MVKRFSKKQGSKQGVILLTVVLILAMAVIFISACMVMTQATRNRLYWKAEQSQARLTVTSAAEAFYQALLVGDFQQDQLIGLAKKGAKDIYMTATDSTGKYLPGMSASDENNCTKLSLKAKDANCSEIYAYLVTTIDGETERVKITFKVKDKPKVYGLFNSPVDMNGSAAQLNFDDVGYVVDGSKPSDNFFVLRGGAQMDNSSSNIYSNMIFAGGTVSEYVANIYGDAVFLKDATISATGGDRTFSWGSGSNVYFTSPDTVTNCFSFGDNQITLNTNNLIFANRNCNSFGKNNKINEKTIIALTIGESGSVSQSTSVTAGTLAHSGTLTDDIKTNAVLYSSKDFNEKVIGSFPTTSEAFAKIKVGDNALETTAPSDYKSYTLEQFVSKYGNTAGGQDKVVGDENGDGVVEYPNIKITSGGDVGDSLNTGTRAVFLLDGSTSYIIYLTGSGNDYNFYQGTFAVFNPKSTVNQVFVLESGVDLTMCCNNAQSIGAGFLSVSRGDDSLTASAYTTYLFGSEGKALINEMVSQTSGGKYSNYWDSKQKPSIYVLGAGSNNVTMNTGAVFEGYMGLFNPTTTIGQSNFYLYNNSEYVYGRLMIDGFDSNTDGGSLNMPYCPGPNTSGSKPDIELYEFGYNVISVDYYYTD